MGLFFFNKHRYQKICLTHADKSTNILHRSFQTNASKNLLCAYYTPQCFLPTPQVTLKYLLLFTATSCVSFHSIHVCILFSNTDLKDSAYEQISQILKMVLSRRISTNSSIIILSFYHDSQASLIPRYIYLVSKSPLCVSVSASLEQRILKGSLTTNG